MNTHTLVRALSKLLPQARFDLVGSRDWCSLTFSGQQLSIECDLSMTDYDRHSSRLAAILPEHEFSIPGCLVANIAVVKRQLHGGRMTLLIEALVIFE